jgi:hypothetical protein
MNIQESINIASKFDAKGFKQAETAASKLTKNLKTLAGAAGLAFSASAIISYSKASVKAFAEDESAALRLNRAVENLGIGFANPGIADYIANLEKSAAIADDVLRPAFQGLLTTTGSLTQSQKLLNDAITISRASGVELATVAEDLGKGYVGITRGLAKYNTGLTQAELKTKTFSDILGIILNRSAGAAEDYLTTTSYKMEVLSIATGNASEIIGEGLVDALARVGGGTEASDAAKAIETLAKAFNFVTLSTGTAVGGLTSVLRNLRNLPKNIFEGFVGKQTGINPPFASQPKPTVSLSEKKQQQALAALEIAAIKRQKELNALKNKQLDTQRKLAADKKKQEALDKAALVLAQGKKVFDEEGIQLAAAAQGKLTKEEEIRVALKKDIYELEAAINEENLTAAARLSNSMVDNARKLSALRGDMIGLGTVPNPFSEWLSTLEQMAAQLAALAAFNLPVTLPVGIPSNFQPFAAKGKNAYEGFGSGMSDLGLGNYGGLAGAGQAGGGGAPVVNINVAGSVTTDRDLVSMVTNAIYNNQASGIPINYSTSYA